jgi:hypothetical protein
MKTPTVAVIFCSLFLAAASNVMAQSQDCALGTKVQLKEGSTGTLAEIGTERPHVGWYRIVHTWSPRGEWYDPKTWVTYIAGTETRCLPGATATPPPATPAPSRPAPTRPDTRPTPTTPATPLPAGGECPFVEPPGRVSHTAPASEQLFKRIIYEREAARINPASISAPTRIGLTFLAFEMLPPYKNTLTAKRFGDKRLHTGAPVDATIYPLRTRELQCDLHGDEVRRSVTEESHDCFKNRDSEWVCPGTTLKTIERRLIPVK